MSGIYMSNILPTENVKLYRIWTSMLYRCHRKDNSQFKNYVGRGIFVCNEWHDFNVFCHDVGQLPGNGYHLDRIDNDKGYFKENCRWVLPKVNHRNKRNNHYYQTHIGKICKSEFIENIGYTRKQFDRAIEKYGETRFLEMFKYGNLPKKRIIPCLNDILGTKFGKITVLRLDEDKSTGARYFCRCECGNETRISRFKLINGLIQHCKGCSKRGEKNPNSITNREKRKILYKCKADLHLKESD